MWGKNKYSRYLRIARASANETDYWLHVARDCRPIQDEDYDRMIGLTDERLRMLSAMISKLRQTSAAQAHELSETYDTSIESVEL